MIFRLDMITTCLGMLLVALGFVAIASATAYSSEVIVNAFVLRQIIYVGLAAVVFLILVRIPMNTYVKFRRFIYLGTLILALIVLVPWIGVVAGGGRRWIDLGLMTVQVTEIARFLIVVYVAGYLSYCDSEIRESTLVTMKPFFWVGIVLFLFLLQPDFGSAVLIGAVTAGMVFLAGARFRDLAIIGLVGIGGLAYVLYHRSDRILAFLDTWNHSSHAGYQLAQSLIGFGRGELTGVGMGDSIQKLRYLPESHNDFIFSVIVEETGFVGGTILLLLLMFLAYRCIRFGAKAIAEQQWFAGYFCYGAGLMLGLQTLINVGVSMGALPTKGLTLPFISFGGNSLIVCVALLAVVCRAELETRFPEYRTQYLS